MMISWKSLEFRFNLIRLMIQKTPKWMTPNPNKIDKQFLLTICGISHAFSLHVLKDVFSAYRALATIGFNELIRIMNNSFSREFSYLPKGMYQGIQEIY